MLLPGESIMEQNFDHFYRSLQRGPAFLFLGQAYLGAETGVDPFLSELLRKFGATPDISSHYRAILGSEAGEVARGFTCVDG